MKKGRVNMNEKDNWIEEVSERIPANEISLYGNTKHHVAANYYRILLGLPILKSHDESIVFIDELFRIPFEELITIPTLIYE